MALAQGQGVVRNETGPYHDEMIAKGGQGKAPTFIPEAKNQRIKMRNYTGKAGQRIQIQRGTQNKIRLMANGISADCDCNLTQEQIQNKTKLEVKLSNGKNAEIKIMPNTASKTALQKLRLKNCNESNNCSIELKEIKQNNKVQAAYEMQVQKHARILGIFQAKMQNKIQINAENGEIINIKKPWWAFLATESTEE